MLLMLIVVAAAAAAAHEREPVATWSLDGSALLTLPKPW